MNLGPPILAFEPWGGWVEASSKAAKAIPLKHKCAPEAGNYLQKGRFVRLPG
jgi:hypothetical protein